ncbi:MAG: Mfa1 family fimbria major subunit [Paraprevotella sp.]|nr:Mfa1 family fimbria major subunit [Paraprevotella sp.]
MMKKVYDILLLAIAVFVSAGFASCSDTAGDLTEGGMDYSKTETYITFNVSLPIDDTRAGLSEEYYPDGDDFKPGSTNEDRIDDMSFFLFNMHSWGVDGSLNCLFKGHLDNNSDVEWKEENGGVSMTFRLVGYRPQEDDRVIVVANIGNKLDQITKLEDLRNYLDYEAWRTNGTSLSDCDHFVLSSSYDDLSNGKVEFLGRAGSKKDPYITGVRLHRVSARIDFLYDPARNTSGDHPASFDYHVRQSPGNENTPLLGTMRITHIVPLNIMQHSSYIIRRVTDTSDIRGGHILYGGREKKDANGIPSNYVVEPESLNKGVKNNEIVKDDLSGWYGNTRADYIFASPTEHLTGNGIADYMQNKRQEDGLTFVTVAYANENTQPKELHSSKYMTGLMLRTIYVPATVYADGNATTKSAEDFSNGRTFWRYVPAYSSSGESGCLYFDNAAAASAYQTAHAGTVTEYPEGLSYYNVWIRHAQTDTPTGESYPMEYAIVRNNIYRIEVQYVTGPGSPTPGEDTPNAGIHIYVKKWNKRVQPSIRL